jgi:dienelactone hydrolase
MQEFLCITLKTKDTQETNARFYPATNAKKAVILVGGIGGGFDSPAQSLYPKLATQLANEGINALRVKFRYPTNLEESVLDVLAGAKFLLDEGAEELGLVGHSFGGAVVIQAGAKLEAAKTVVTLATQGYHADAVLNLPPHVSILLIHGANDETLSPENSQLVYRLAKEPKKRVILEGNRHGLHESAEQVFNLVHDWLKTELGS